MKLIKDIILILAFTFFNIFIKKILVSLQRTLLITNLQNNCIGQQL